MKVPNPVIVVTFETTVVVNATSVEDAVKSVVGLKVFNGSYPQPTAWTIKEVKVA